MKLFKAFILFTIITTFSCSKDTEETSELPEQGTVSIALSNGAGFVAEDLVATVNNHYDKSNSIVVTITGTVGSTGKLKITLIDNDNSFKAIVNENSFPVGDTSKSFYATVEYEDDTFGNLNGLAGSVEIINYFEFGAQKYSVLTATFSAAGNSKNMTSSILDLVLNCTGC